MKCDIMRSIFLFMLLILAGIQVFPQSYIMRNVTDLSDQYSLEKINRDPTLAYADVEGSPYLNEEFENGKIVIDDSLIYQDIPVRYNIYSDRIEFQSKLGQVMELEIPELSLQVTYGFHRFIYTDFLDRGKEVEGMLEILAEGNVGLFKQYRVTFKEATKPRGYEDAKPNRFVRQADEYLLSVGNGVPETFRNSKAIMEKLETIRPEINEYRKRHKLKLRSEQDLIALVRYCNEEDG